MKYKKQLKHLLLGVVVLFAGMAAIGFSNATPVHAIDTNGDDMNQIPTQSQAQDQANAEQQQANDKKNGKDKDKSSDDSSSSSDSNNNNSSNNSNSAGTKFANAAKKMALTDDSGSGQVNQKEVNLLKCPGDVWGALGSANLSIAASDSGFQSTVSYNSLGSAFDTSSNGKSFSAAAAFAYQLNATGLDKSTGNNSAAAGFGAHIMGMFESLVVDAGNLSSWAWKLASKILQATNVFAWMESGSESGFLSNTPIGAFLHHMYLAAKGLGITLSCMAFGLAIGLAILGVQMTKGGRTTPGGGIMHAFGMLVVKVFGAVLLVPALVITWGAFITNVTPIIDSMANINPADDMILSTVVNNHDWALKGRYTTVGSINNVLKNTTDTDAAVPVLTHGQIAAINQNGAGMSAVKNADVTGMTNGLSGQSVGMGDQNYLSSLDGGGNSGSNKTTKDDVNKPAMALWNEYVNEDNFTAGDYASYALGHLSLLSKYNTLSDRNKVVDAFTKNLNSSISNDNGKSSKNQDDTSKYSSGVSPLVNGSLGVSGGKFECTGSGAPIMADQMGGAFSTLGAYVYLASSTNQNSFEYNDLANATNGSVIARHLDATIPTSGSRLLWFVYMAQLIVVPLVLLLFSLGCIWGVIQGTLTGVFSAIGVTPLAELGSISAMARLVAAFCTMVVSVFGGLVVYGAGMTMASGLINSIGSGDVGAVMHYSHQFGAMAVAGSTWWYITCQIGITVGLIFVLLGILKIGRKILDAIKGLLEDMGRRVVSALEMLGTGAGAMRNAVNHIANHGNNNNYSGNNYQNNMNNERQGDQHNPSNSLNEIGGPHTVNPRSGDIDDSNNPSEQDVDQQEGPKSFGQYDNMSTVEGDENELGAPDSDEAIPGEAGDTVGAADPTEEVLSQDTGETTNVDDGADIEDGSRISQAIDNSKQGDQNQSVQAAQRQQQLSKQHSNSRVVNSTKGVQAGRSNAQGKAAATQGRSVAAGMTKGSAANRISAAAVHPQGKSAGRVQQVKPSPGRVNQARSQLSRAQAKLRGEQQNLRQAQAKNPAMVASHQARVAKATQDVKNAKTNAQRVFMEHNTAPADFVRSGVTAPSMQTAFDHASRIQRAAANVVQNQSAANQQVFQREVESARKAGLRVDNIQLDKPQRAVHTMNNRLNVMADRINGGMGIKE